MARPIPTRETAQGMLDTIKREHVCGEACTTVTTLGDGTRLQLRCPLGDFDLGKDADRLTVQSLYMEGVRTALRSAVR